MLIVDNYVFVLFPKIDFDKLENHHFPKLFLVVVHAFKHIICKIKKKIGDLWNNLISIKTA